MSDWYRTVSGLVTAPEREALRLEARRLRGTAETSERLDFRLVEGVQLLSPARNRFVQAGASRHSLHTHALAGRVSARLGHAVNAVLSSYLIYERGDFLGLHIDQRLCQLTVLVLLDGEAG